MRTLAIYLTVLCPLLSFAQIHCGSVAFEPNTPVPVNLSFDSFTSYEGGVTLNNVATLRVRVEDQAIPDPDCRWFLTMMVDNSPASGTAPGAWESLSNYGSGMAPMPSIDLLQIRIRNGCQTSPLDGVFQNFTNHGDIIDIIADLLPTTPAGSCVTNVNGPGDYLNHYNEYTFAIDVRVRPGYDFSPGIYELAVRFHLEEQM